MEYLWYDAHTYIMLMIRLQRIGRKNQAAFRVLVIDSHRGPKAGKNVEMLGSYSPHTNVLTIQKERVLYWMSVGAQVSDTLRNLLITNKILEGRKINVLPRKSPPVKEQVTENTREEVATEVAPVEETPVAKVEEPHAKGVSVDLPKSEAGEVAVLK